MESTGMTQEIAKKAYLECDRDEIKAGTYLYEHRKELKNQQNNNK